YCLLQESRLGLVISQPYEHGSNLLHHQAVIDLQILRRVARHLPERRIPRGLHDRDAAMDFDCDQPGCAVVSQTAQNHTDGFRPESGGCGAKQRIDRRTEAVLPGAASHPNGLPLQGHVIVRRSEVDAAGTDGLPIRRMNAWYRTAPREGG